MTSINTLQLGWLDYTLLAVLLVSVLVGLLRGLVFECLSLVGWVVAWFTAQWAAPQLTPHLAPYVPAALAHPGAAFALCFIAALVVWTLLAKLIRLIIHATPLSLIDRLLGSLFGLLRGGVLLLAVATVVLLSPLAQTPAWRTSQVAQVLGVALQTLKPLLPDGVSRLLPSTSPSALAPSRAGFSGN
jgi:membrane protein required for colicin V production